MNKWDENQYQQYRRRGVWRVDMGLINPMETKEGMEEKFRQHEQRVAGMKSLREEIVEGEDSRRDEKTKFELEKAAAYFKQKEAEKENQTEREDGDVSELV